MPLILAYAYFAVKAGTSSYFFGCNCETIGLVLTAVGQTETDLGGGKISPAAAVPKLQTVEDDLRTYLGQRPNDTALQDAVTPFADALGHLLVALKDGSDTSAAVADQTAAQRPGGPLASYCPA